MNQLAVKLGYFGNAQKEQLLKVWDFSSQNNYSKQDQLFDGHMHSVQSRDQSISAPSKILSSGNHTDKKKCLHTNARLISAHERSIMKEKEGVVGGKIGVLPGISFIRFWVAKSQRNFAALSSLSSALFLTNLNEHNKTTSRHLRGKNYYGEIAKWMGEASS